MLATLLKRKCYVALVYLAGFCYVCILKNYVYSASYSYVSNKTEPFGYKSGCGIHASNHSIKRPSSKLVMHV